MISQGSCDTEYWSNGCWKFSFGSQNIFHNITVFTVFPNK